MTAEDWVAAFATELGMSAPDLKQFDLILALAAEAAHSSEKIAAPAACWIAGASGKPLDELIAAAERIGGD